MSVFPDKVSKAWDERKGPIVFTTVDKNGVPNAIYATCVSKFDEDTLVIADNFFDKTRRIFFQGVRGVFFLLLMKIRHFKLRGALNTTKKVIFLRT